VLGKSVGFLTSLTIKDVKTMNEQKNPQAPQQPKPQGEEKKAEGEQNQ